jgi:hypothetical protein
MERPMSSPRKFDTTSARQTLSNGPGEIQRLARKANETLIRQKQFKIHTARRRIAEIESAIADFDRMANALETEIHVEQKRARFDDPLTLLFPFMRRR